MRLFHRLLAMLWLTPVVVLCACAGAGGEAAPTLAPTALVSTTLPTITATRRPPTATLVPATATTTTLPSPTPCQLPVQSALSDAWNPDELGCPITLGDEAISTAYAPFAGGQMLWRGDTDTIYVLYPDGTWLSYPNTWRPGDPEFSCGEADPLTTPIRGFGRVWCDHPAVREALGAATAAEIGDSASAVQDFVNGAIFVAPFGRPFVFVGEDGVWRQLDE